MGHYLSVFFESAWVASVVPMGSEPSFFAMLAFGSFSMLPAWIAAVSGATLGHVFNWYVGKLFLKIGEKSKKPLNQQFYAKAQGYFRKYGIFLLLFSWVTLMNLVVVAAGIFKVRLKTVLTLVIIGQAAHYGYYLL